MRLQELYIKDYKVLQDFTLRFDEESAISVLIGENGSGKTTVVECLTLIFTELFQRKTLDDLYEKVDFAFDFRISYFLRKETRIESNLEAFFHSNYFRVEFEYSNRRLAIDFREGNHIHNSATAISGYLRDNGQSVNYLLPQNLVIYYSGIADILYKHFQHFQEDVIRGSLHGANQIEQPFFYFQPNNFSVILIGLLAIQYGKVPDILREEFGILGFYQIKIIITKPSWGKKEKVRNFWGAKGDLAASLAAMRQSLPDSVFEEEQIEFRISNSNQLNDLLYNYFDTEKRLFEYLFSLQANGLISNVEVSLYKKLLALPIVHQRLSEGEKQRLIIIGLKELMSTESSLFLLDEPDTYLHPKWKQEFVENFLNDDESFSTFSLITTHSPGIVSGMRKSQLHILKKEDGKSVSKTFSFNPYGKPEDQILFDFFGITGLRYKPVEKQLEELRSLINEGEYESEKFNDLFQRVENEIGKGDEGLNRLKLEIVRRKRANQ